MTKKVFFTGPEKTKLCGIIENPTDRLDRPIVIIVHGFTSNKDSSSFKKIIENLSNEDISSFRIDLFGHGDSGGDFADITITKGKDSVLAAVMYLKSQGYQYIGLLGSSFGGISSIMAANESDDIFFMALKSPVSDWLDISTTRNKKFMDEWKTKGIIDYKEGGKSYKLKYKIIDDSRKNVGFDVASNISIPTLIVHGNADEIVPFSGSKKMVELMPNAVLHTVNGANHNYSDSSKSFNEMTEVISSFLINQSNKFIS